MMQEFDLETYPYPKPERKYEKGQVCYVHLGILYDDWGDLTDTDESDDYLKPDKGVIVDYYWSVRQLWSYNIQAGGRQITIDEEDISLDAQKLFETAYQNRKLYFQNQLQFLEDIYQLTKGDIV